MNDVSFQIAIMDFERAIIMPGILGKVIGKVELIPVRRGKLANTDFGKAVGTELYSDQILAVDYYGYTKKSTGFFQECTTIKSEFPEKQVKMVEAPIVHFASLRIEDIALICTAPEVIAGFPNLKGEVLIRRGFKK